MVIGFFYLSCCHSLSLLKSFYRLLYTSHRGSFCEKPWDVYWASNPSSLELKDEIKSGLVTLSAWPPRSACCTLILTFESIVSRLPFLIREINSSRSLTYSKASSSSHWVLELIALSLAISFAWDFSTSLTSFITFLAAN